MYHARIQYVYYPEITLQNYAKKIHKEGTRTEEVERRNEIRDEIDKTSSIRTTAEKT